MANRIKLTFWNYVDFSDYKPEMLEDWVNCGMTDPVTPRFTYEKDSHEDFKAMLDLAERLGVKMILQINELSLEQYLNGAEKYARIAREVYDEFGIHPAAEGFYVGEEPNTTTNEAYFEGVKILRDIDPKFPVFVNLGSVERTERMLLGPDKSLKEWMSEFTSYSGTDIIGYGTYAQLLPNGVGIDEHFYNIREVVKAAKASGAEVWASQLSSAHYGYRIPSELDFQWQISTTVACGCRAVVWFRLYDKLIAPDLWGSPIDEFGEKTPRYYDLARVQKRFMAQHGEIMAKLRHVDSFGLGVSYGGYLYFLPGSNDLVESAVCRSGMISFFKDDEGSDYVVVLNTLQDEACTFALNFTEKVEKAAILRLNGKQRVEICNRGDKKGMLAANEIWLAPGQMELIKLN